MSARVTGIAREPGYTVVENASLAGRNTFRVPARAALLIEVTRSDVLPEVLGEGSNVLFTRDWPGVVLAVGVRGIQMLEDGPEGARVRVAAGENWHDFVLWSLARGYAGLENLALIPGTVGAAPIQNIGAYGAEASEFIQAVDVYDRQLGRGLRLANADCGFAYRDSIFKREPGRLVVGAVEFLLPRVRQPRLDYAGVRDELATMGVTAPTPVTVAEAVMRLRTRKLPNPALIGNAGSFFKNPAVSPAQAEALRREHPALVAWELADGRCKLSAAWLIEACGFKGLREGDAGVSSQHALVLVNHGQATGAQIWALAERVREAVERRFGVRLEPEPVVV